jgi:RNA polymerase sigma-70 factor (ECF subfamily)
VQRGDLEALLAEAREACPGIDLDPERFLAFLQERDIDNASRDRLGDLYLACACATGDKRAAAELERRHARVIRAAILRGASADMADDLHQQVLAKVLVGDAERPAAIASYRGDSKLATWLHVIARRLALQHQRDATRGGVVHRYDAVEAIADRAVGEDALLAGLKRAYRSAFRDAFKVALERLSARERNLLRYECIDGLTRDEIARIYDVSRATVARWRTLSRARLYQETCAAFREVMAVPDEEMDSILAMIQSQLDVSLSRLLD